ncbi:crAss001_48 related protein [Blautia obeum]|mgnify:FL=1|jgi:hypothetical protein|uniref:Uncharacterized protein n=1 Tax=Blautia obeum TaxID=40520 RepID=A0A415HVM5_9FIRM|nr:hypothetical protein [Blautia obeum]RHK98285.1 hypothetical protein DW040_02975 [Blautia obeum]
MYKTLNETVDGMCSTDYKERFVAEYNQLVIRYRGLKNMLDKWDRNELDFTPTCPRSTYNLQIKAMTDYIDVLEARAAMENIYL